MPQWPVSRVPPILRYYRPERCRQRKPRYSEIQRSKAIVATCGNQVSRLSSPPLKIALDGEVQGSSPPADDRPECCGMPKAACLLHPQACCHKSESAPLQIG